MHPELFDGSPELTSLVRTLYRLFGEGPFPEDELRIHIASVLAPSAESLRGKRFLNLGISSIVRSRAVKLDSDGAFRLTTRAAAFAKDSVDADERELELIALDVDMLFADAELPAPSEAREAPPERIDCVTPSFLAEALAEAELPPELFETILATYREHGRVIMSEDGGAYRFVLGTSPT